ncbi:DUF4116 domain-containing protein [Legionella sp. km772]|uniref:DUF4116 domain-containing protein n=1 Tax=Legionella sp. km772 TaxID=2498111 RepID=UPI000F8F573E|nr:DUF4116 domain-containing protein [Legionella sp. km772]RUR09221.1 DUF4116 domain-containing protein [Legionella sp. km772]
MALETYQLELLKTIENKGNTPQLPQELTENQEFILKALEITPNVWRQVSPKLKSNKQFMLLAIEQNSNAFIFGASDELRDDEEVALAAVKKNSALLFYVSDRLKRDESFKDKATKRNSWFPIIKFNKLMKNNFFEGITDTFAIMLGDYGLLTKMDGGELSSNRYKYGLVDLTLIPLISNALINYGFPNKPSITNPFRFVRDEEKWDSNQLLRGIALGLGFGLQVVRLGLALLATLMVLPIVAFVHLIKFPYMAYQQNKLFALEGEIYTDPNKTPLKKGTLGEFAKQTNSSLNDFCKPHFYKAEENDLTTLSAENTHISSYGSLKSTTTSMFFRPTHPTSTSQKNALQVGNVPEVFIDKILF